ncbi:Ribonuclease Y [endosymbiont DhMRE of Dentiscutata heterogama]|uniref:HDIG domain-containing metalloprotein n=1 Tax=endosymbiont DhMRE of Dentiscutata heterogama TaxID=1609546 RepID=UPI000629D272|nr:HDIG domain-containing metalloprotein [endosymbiont DhMRE of Dentiscutata heterogama]CFW92906.1 Ribonuclease Y [endosymbiont DhMRE of Dentiscutata heterogama]
MNFLQWIRDGYGYLFLLFTLFLIILFLVFFTYLKRAYWGRLEVGKLLRSQKKREEQLKIKEKKLQTAIKQLLSKREKLQQEEKRINEFTKQLFRKEELFTQQLALSSHKEKTIREEMEKVKEIRERVIGHLEKIIPLSKEEAKKDLLIVLRAEVDRELEWYKEEKIRQSERIAKEESAKIICQALEKCSSELVFTKTTDALRVESPQIISKIIGKDGRNINAFHRITGTELIIDKESDELTIQISSFNSLRRAIGLQTLRNLIKEVKFSPLHIEKIYQEVSAKTDELIIKTGNEVVEELGLSDVHPEIIKHLGKLKYRTSYGQNVLEHCLEVAKLAGSIAAELDLDVLLARRAGLFHDIGKAVEDGGNYSHVRSGISLAKKFQEPEIVINAIASHHRDFPPTNLYSLIVLAADKLSAARPGVRGYQSEAYIERMNSLENIANNFPGIKKSYAFQAGREVWVFVDAEKLNDHKTWEIARKIREKIKKDIVIPGEVTIQVVREKRFTQRLHHRPEPIKIKSRSKS